MVRTSKLENSQQSTSSILGFRLSDNQNPERRNMSRLIKTVSTESKKDRQSPSIKSQQSG